MSFDMKAVSGRNSSALVAYYLRTTETGWYVATDVLKNTEFREALNQMIRNRASELSDKVTKLGASHKAVLLEDRLKHLKVRVPKSVGGDAPTQQLVQTVHKAGLSLLLDRVDARTGQIFQVQLPNGVAGDVEYIAKEIRNLFPSNVPMMITIHTGDNCKNLHLQGWFCDRSWDSQEQKWSSPLSQFRTKTGLSEFRARIDAVLTEYNAVWKHDPNAPKRAVFHPAKSQFMKSMSHEELLKGDFLKDIQNPLLRKCLEEEITIARYHKDKRKTHKPVSGVSEDLELFMNLSNSLETEVVASEDEATKSIKEELERLGHRKAVLRPKKL